MGRSGRGFSFTILLVRLAILAAEAFRFAMMMADAEIPTAKTVVDAIATASSR
jgi:hypothetical protein